MTHGDKADHGAPEIHKDQAVRDFHREAGFNVDDPGDGDRYASLMKWAQARKDGFDRRTARQQGGVLWLLGTVLGAIVTGALGYIMTPEGWKWLSSLAR